MYPFFLTILFAILYGLTSYAAPVGAGRLPEPPAPALAVSDFSEDGVLLDVENGADCLCLVLVRDASGALLDAHCQWIETAHESVRLDTAFPTLPAEYRVQAFLLKNSFPTLRGCCDATAVVYSKTVSDSRVTGVFVAPWMASDATSEEWVGALSNMKDVGISTVIVQYCYQNDPVYGHQAYFPFGDADTVSDAGAHPLRRSQISFLLAAAKSLNMQVYLGLQVAEREWFDRNMYKSRDWLNRSAALSESLANALFDAFGETYGDVIAGWYLPFEFESSDEYHGYFSQITSEYYAPLTAALKSSVRFGDRDILISPLAYRADDLAAWKENLEIVLTGAAIDIVALQDGIGFGTQSHETVSAWFSATREAVESANAVRPTPAHLWGNCENYARLRNPNETDPVARVLPMSVGKFITSLDVAYPYVEKLVTFSIHRWDTALVSSSRTDVNRPYYEAYKQFFASGKKPQTCSDGYYVSLRAASGAPLRYNAHAAAGLTDGFAADPDRWEEYLGVSTENGEPFVMELLFDDPTPIRSVASHYYREKEAAVMLPAEIRYEYLVRSGKRDECFTWTAFASDSPIGPDGAARSRAELPSPVLADGVRVAVTPGGEWTFVDELCVE